MSHIVEFAQIKWSHTYPGPFSRQTNIIPVIPQRNPAGIQTPGFFTFAFVLNTLALGTGGILFLCLFLFITGKQHEQGNKQ